MSAMLQEAGPSTFTGAADISVGGGHLILQCYKPVSCLISEVREA